MDTEAKSFLRIFITGCLWGTIGLFVKMMEAQGSSSSYTSFLRLFFGFVALAILTVMIDGAKAFRIGPKTLVSCIISFALMTAFYAHASEALKVGNYNISFWQILHQGLCQWMFR